MNNSKQLLLRYDEFFGSGTSRKLLDAKNKYSQNQFVRVNISKANVEDVKKFLKTERVKFSETFFSNAIKIEKSFFSLTGSFYSLTGKIYMQDLASQIPVNCIDFSKLKNLSRKIRVLDMAASPGSKTTQIADALCFNGIEHEIVALEPEVKRLTKLINNVQRQGFSDVSIRNVSGENFSDNLKFDVILLDAPCSGNLVGDKDWLLKRDITGIEEKAALQRKLLENASKMLTDEGLLVYSTCSLEPEEDECNVDFAVKKLGLKIVPSNLKLPFDASVLKMFKGKRLESTGAVRIMPHLSGTQGFFVSCFRKK